MLWSIVTSQRSSSVPPIINCWVLAAGAVDDWHFNYSQLLIAGCTADRGGVYRQLFHARCILVLFLAAIRSFRRQDASSLKLYMLFASLTILLPAFGRIADVFFGRPEPSLIMFLATVILLPVVYDKTAGQRIHKATIVGIAGTIAWVIMMVVTIFSPAGPWLVEQVS